MLFNRARRLNEIALPGHMMFGHIILGVNNFCNLRCIMCDVGTGNSETNFGGNLTGAKFRSMPWEIFKRVADEAHALWPKAHLGFVYTESLAWLLIGKSLDYARAGTMDLHHHQRTSAHALGEGHRDRPLRRGVGVAGRPGSDS
jgi:hypothetical protein